MSSLNNRNNQGITEYSALVCLLLFKVWCGFANQALLFAAGAGVSGIIDFALCGYLVLNARRINKDRNKNRVTYNFLIVMFVFFVIYMLFMALGRDSLPPTTFLGVLPLPKQISNTLFLLIYMGSMITCVKNLSEEERRFVSGFLVAIFFAVTLANLITVIINPELAKNESYNEGTSLFTLGYSGSYPVAILTPILLYLFGESKNKRLFGFIVACHLVSIFYGGYFIAGFATLFVLLVYAILAIKNKIVLIVLMILLAASGAGLFFSGALEELMRYLAETVEIDVFSDRFSDIATYLGGDTDVTSGDTTIRIKIYQETFNHFLNHPIFGNFIFGIYNAQRDHATILDLLAIGGVFLGGLFCAFMAFGYKFVAAFLKNEKAKRAFVAAMAEYLFIAMINPVLLYKPLGVLFVVAPIMLGGETKGEVDENS